MASKLARLSIAEIRERFAGAGEAITPRTLGQLRRDPRLGVRQIYTTLKNRYARDCAERDRIEAILCRERALWSAGVERIAGVDEAGMGPLAGPVIAAAVIFAPQTTLPGIDDSKRLDAEERAAAELRIRAAAVAIGIGRAEVEEIDRINIYQAGLLAMRRAVEALSAAPEHVLVDARRIPGVAAPQDYFVRGDASCFSIAAASIVAKQHRDRVMDELAAQYPGYGFERHRGYATPEHQAALRSRGPCAAHRRSFTLLPELVQPRLL